MPIKSDMPVRVLVADDSAIMLEAIRKLLDGERQIEIVGEASTFAAAMQMIADLKPDVLVLDLHMPHNRGLHVPLVKAQLSCVEYTLAISFANDEEAKSLAAGYGAIALLDKMNLYSQLVPAITRLAEQGATPGHNLELQPGTNFIGEEDGLSLEPSE